MEVALNPSTSILIDEKKYHYFSGTNYLGVTSHPKFQKILFESFTKWGSSYGSSRNANLKLSIYSKAESYFSQFFKSVSSVSVSSGTLAGQLVLKTLENEVAFFYHMPKTHPAILHPKSEPVFTNNQLHPSIKTLKNTSICILGDAIATLETAPYSYDFLSQFHHSVKIILLIDESHSVGVLGENGCGVTSQIPSFSNVSKLSIASLGKAFGLTGGVIYGDNSLIKKIKNQHLFIGSAGMSPAFLDCFLEATSFYQQQQKKLQARINHVYQKLHAHPKITMAKNYPVLFYDDEQIAEYLFNHQIIITNFYYPTISKKINRIVINAEHNFSQLDFLIEKIQAYPNLH